MLFDSKRLRQVTEGPREAGDRGNLSEMLQDMNSRDDGKGQS